MRKTGEKQERGQDIAARQQSFNAAMALYDSRKGYRWFGTAVAASNVALQLWLLWSLRETRLPAWALFAALLAAWPLTDFVNGLVHMYMDSNDDYESPFGPFIANFHMHHRTPRYTPRSLPVVYFLETGSKIWLVPCLAAIAALNALNLLDPWVFCLLALTGVLSSVAEVSHYLCHTSTSPVAKFLGDCRILLPKRHHAVHHLRDNVSYAFLNGLTDPLLNLLAAKIAPGYKNHTDLHYATYAGENESR